MQDLSKGYLSSKTLNVFAVRHCLNLQHRPTKFYDQNVTGQWAHVSGLIFQADFESENHFSLSGLVLLT